MSYSSQVQQYSVPPLQTPAQPMLAPVMYTYQNGMAFFNMPVSGNTSVSPQASGLQNSTSTDSLVPSVYAAGKIFRNRFWSIIYFRTVIIVFSSLWNTKYCQYAWLQ